MITVFGSINVDLVCRVTAAPRLGETVIGSDYGLFPGGKGANQALAARRAGAAVRMVGAVGNDPVGSIALVEVKAAGVDLAGVARLRGTTGLAIITVDRRGENMIVVSPGANNSARSSAIPAEGLGRGDTLLIQMEVPLPENWAAAHRAREAGARVILSLAPFAALSAEELEPVSILIVNETEAGDLAHHLGLATSGGTESVAALSDRLGRTVIATLGPKGAVAAGPEGLVEVSALPITPVDTTGAGDTFAGVLAAYLDEGADLRTAMAHAAVAGSLTCTKEGAQPSFPTRAEIEAALG